MRFICLGYHDESKWETVPESEQRAFMERCFDYDGELRRSGQFTGGEALQTARNGVTLRLRDGQVAVTDGPFAETKEQIGGILILEARDLNHAIAIMSKHPGLGAGPFEIRAADETMEELYQSYAAERPISDPSK